MRKKTHSEFLKEISGLPLSPLGEYETALQKIIFRCDTCGHVWGATPANILSGKCCPKCSYKKRGIAARKKITVLEDRGDWVLLDVSSKKHPVATMSIDKGDLCLIDRGVHIGSHGYPAMSINGACVCVHVLLNPNWKESDHIDRDRTNNRRRNLRECTRSENLHNKSMDSRNKSGTTGVCFYKNRWVAQITVNGKNYNLGRFVSKEDAIAMRKDAEKKLLPQVYCE